MLKRTLRKLSFAQPFNRLATATVKAAFAATGLRSLALTRALIRVGEIRVRLPNGETFKLAGRGDESHGSQIFWWGWDAMEPETYPVWYALAREARVVLDIGAYIGEMALVAAAANARSKVYAFEPMPATFERLKHHASINRLANLECFHLGLSDRAGRLPIYHEVGGRPSLETSTSFSLEFMNQNPSPGKQLAKADVEVMTIDAWAEARGVREIDLVKIDTESTEPAVLRGMLTVLKRDKPDLIVECLPGSGTREAVDALVLPLGYVAHRLVNRTARQKLINSALNELAGRQDERTHNVLYSARGYDLGAKIAAADRAASS